MADPQLKIKIEGDIKDYIDSLVKANEKTKQFSDRFVIGYTDMKNIAKDLFSVISSSVEEYNKTEEAVRELGQAMVNAGTFSGRLKDSYLSLAGEMQKVTRFGDDQTIAAISVLQAYTKQIPVTEDLVKATMNLATAKKIDLASAAELIGKTIDGETNMLKRQGIEITNAASANERMGDVIDKINKKYQDYAISAGQGSGQITIFKNATNDFLKALGEKFAPIVNDAAGALAKLIAEGTSYITGNKEAARTVYDVQWAIKKTTYEMQALEDVLAKIRAKGQLRGSDVIEMGATEIKLQNARDKLKLLEQELKAFNLRQKDIDDNARKNALTEDAKQQEQLLTQQIEAKEASYALIGKRDEDRALAQLDFEMKIIDQSLKLEDDKIKKVQMLKVKNSLADSKRRILEQKAEEELLKQDLSKTVAMAQSKNALIASIGKAASLRQIWIDAPKNAQAAYGAMVGIPIVGPALAQIAQIASWAFSAESAAKVVAANRGGLITGGVPGIDSVHSMLTPGELVVPEKNFEEVVTATAASRQGELGGVLEIRAKDNLLDWLEIKMVERRALRLTVEGT